MITIRQATLSDAPVVAGFNRCMALETEQFRLDPAVLDAGVAAVLADAAKGLYLVAEVDDEIAGQLLITHEWSDWRNGNWWWIQSVYVRPAFRGQGVFRALFEQVARLARARPGIAGLRLYMHRANHRARHAYTQLGMKHSGYEVFEMDFVLSGRGAADPDAPPRNPPVD